MTPWPPEIATVEGRFVDASNATLLARSTDGQPLIYKPEAGQRPLHDFDVATLPRREYLAFRVSVELGLECVPRTALIEGPAGAGSVQSVIAHQTDVPALVDMINAADDRLWPLALLDVIINNADRKVGHIFVVDDHLWGIDHGLTFHPQEKLRTVLWSFAGQPIPAHLRDRVSTLSSADALFGEVESLLGASEADGLARRINEVLATGIHPYPPVDRPAMPWPHF